MLLSTNISGEALRDYPNNSRETSDALEFVKDHNFSVYARLSSIVQFVYFLVLRFLPYSPSSCCSFLLFAR